MRHLWYTILIDCCVATCILKSYLWLDSKLFSLCHVDVSNVQYNQQLKFLHQIRNRNQINNFKLFSKYIIRHTILLLPCSIVININDISTAIFNRSLLHRTRIAYEVRNKEIKSEQTFDYSRYVLFRLKTANDITLHRCSVYLEY